ncbi:MAG TPA: MerR family transcriptional regulator [Acidimicrobiales bacterium]|nr:MerR family transcriptional regulator [Acidimicrobiales bacterium]
MTEQVLHTSDEPVALTVDDLARRADLPVRTIREYQTMGLLPPPARRGRVGFYGPTHLRRLGLIARLKDRGYSLAGIRDLLGAWRDGADLGEVLGLDPDELVHIDEPGAPATAAQLARALPGLVPDRLDDLLATGAVELGPSDRYCVPSPSLLLLAADALHAGYDADRVLALLATIRDASDTIAAAATAIVAAPPSDADPARLLALASRGRGLLAHGAGRLTLHALGKRLGVTDDSSVPETLRRLLGT